MTPTNKPVSAERIAEIRKDSLRAKNLNVSLLRLEVRDLLQAIVERDAELRQEREFNVAHQDAIDRLAKQVASLELDRKRLVFILDSESTEAGILRAEISSETGVTRSRIDAAIAATDDGGVGR